MRTIQEWLGNENVLGCNIWEKKYQHNNETFEQWLDRVSGGDEEIKEMIWKKQFLFGGRILSNRGLEKEGVKVTLSNCYVLEPPKDSIESIFDTASKLARTFSYGGGVGIDISKLSPRGAKVNNTAKETSGAVSFMDLYNLVTDLIGQNGRRGALMLSMDINHPDVEEFIDIKTNLDKVTKANISVRVDEEFMKAVIEDKDHTMEFVREETGEKITKTKKARDIFLKLCKNNWDYAEPGILNWDRIEKWNMLSHDKEFKYTGVNPCLVGSTKIQTTEGLIAIEELVGKNPYVYCMEDNGELGIRKASKVWLTKKNAEIVRVHHHRGHIDCTPDHRIFTLNRGWVEAKDLVKGDELNSLNRNKKDERHCVVKLTSSEKYIVEYKLINGEFNSVEGIDVLDNQSNSNPCNVTSVEVLNYTEDVYDMTVPEVHNFVADGIIVHNCAEEPLPSGGSCLLGSINLASFVKNGKFDIVEFGKVIVTAVKALNEVLDEGLVLHPLAIQRESVRDWRQIGLGIFGLADMLIKLKLPYDSQDAVDFCEELAEYLAYKSIYASMELAREKGAYPKFKAEAILQSQYIQCHCDEDLQDKISKYGLHNSQLLTIAPTGTLSTMIGVSGGLEPIYDTHYVRKTESLHNEDVYYNVYTPIVKEYLDANNIEDIAKTTLPKYFSTAKTIDPYQRVAMQSVWQKAIDASISSTINLHNEATVEQVAELYVMAYKKGLKGLTIFRDGCARVGVLSSPTTEKKEEEPKQVEEQVVKQVVKQEVKQIEGIELDSIVPLSRRDLGTRLQGSTYIKEIACGKMYITVNRDENDNLVEVFIDSGKSGGCQANTECLGRLASSCMRSGVRIEDIVDATKGVKCSACSKVKGLGKAIDGMSCGDVVAKTIQEEYNRYHKGNKEKKCTHITKEEKVEPTNTPKPTKQIAKISCPECGDELLNSGGCVICNACGYSKCS